MREMRLQRFRLELKSKTTGGRGLEGRIIMAGQGCTQLVVRAKGFNTTPEIPSSLLSGSGFQFAIRGFSGEKIPTGGCKQQGILGGGGGGKDKGE
jgi:hypothetical protein